MHLTQVSKFQVFYVVSNAVILQLCMIIVCLLLANELVNIIENIIIIHMYIVLMSDMVIKRLALE